MKIRHSLLSLVLVGILFVMGCATSNSIESPTVSSSASSSVAETSSTQAQATSPSAVPSPEAESEFSNLPRLEGEAIVEMVVNDSPITIVINGLDAPVTAGNFADLVSKGVYDGLSFHRVIREPQPFVVQGGDPQSKDPNFPANLLGTGSYTDPTTGQPRYIPLEIKPEGADQPVYSQTLQSAGVSAAPKLRHTRGAIAMARSNVPDSASSQFYFTLADRDFLDGNYAVFGYVQNGMEIVDQIQQGDRITSAKITTGLENLKPAA